jgi:hypothetical protein
MSHEKFIHHECYSTADADETTRKGFYDVIEDEYGVYVYSGYEGMILQRFDTLEEADAYARKKAGL